MNKMRGKGKCINVCTVRVSVRKFKCTYIYIYPISSVERLFYFFPTLTQNGFPSIYFRAELLIWTLKPEITSGKSGFCPDGFVGGLDCPFPILNSCLVYIQFNDCLASVTGKRVLQIPVVIGAGFSHSYREKRGMERLDLAASHAVYI